MITEQLTQDERDQLFKQQPETKNDGGFQGLLVKLQGQVRDYCITLYDDDIEKINRYYAKYGSGGWQGSYLAKIFGRFPWFKK